MKLGAECGELVVAVGRYRRGEVSAPQPASRLQEARHLPLQGPRSDKGETEREDHETGDQQPRHQPVGPDRATGKRSVGQHTDPHTVGSESGKAEGQHLVGCAAHRDRTGGRQRPRPCGRQRRGQCLAALADDETEARAAHLRGVLRRGQLGDLDRPIRPAAVTSEDRQTGGDRGTVTDVGEHAAAFGHFHASDPDLGVQCGDPPAQGAAAGWAEQARDAAGVIARRPARLVVDAGGRAGRAICPRLRLARAAVVDEPHHEDADGAHGHHDDEQEEDR